MSSRTAEVEGEAYVEQLASMAGFDFDRVELTAAAIRWSSRADWRG